MSDEMFKKPEARWEPGTLDNTRRNIGAIDKEEALRMQKILGGQVYSEKSTPIDYSALPQKHRTYAHRSSGRSSSDVASMSHSSPEPRRSSPDKGSSSPKKEKRSDSGSDGLPVLSPKVRNQMDRLMMGHDYKIKTDLGLFNFMRYLVKGNQEKVNKLFVEFEVKNQIVHLQSFTTSIKTLIQISPDSYKKKILSADEPKFRLLKTVGNWTLQEVKYHSTVLMEHPENTGIADMTNYIKAVYKQCLTIYYMGESNIANYIKDVHADLCKYPKANTDKITTISKQAVTEWLNVYTGVIKMNYPILMRMTSSVFEEFPFFFTSQASTILPFVGLSKFDIQLPEKKNKKQKNAVAAGEATPEGEKLEKTEEDLQKEKEAEEKKKAEEALNPGAKTPVVDAGIRLLEKLFPDAGFSRLDKCPDMYPYFEPIYDFEDGYNVLSCSNPMQVTVVLLTILQDMFQGMRNVEFTIQSDPTNTKQKDNLVTALNEWSIYKENLFEKQYIDQILHFVNQQYTQSDFRTSQLGKKIMTDVLWQTKFNFLPHFEFEQLLLEKPANDNRYMPLYFRTDFLRKTFTELSRKIDVAAKTKDKVEGIDNPWKKYVFDIPNPVSKRLDVLLGAKKSADTTQATNANLIKYAMCIMAVLDWWVNNKESPAYTACSSSHLYRVSPQDGAPVFSVPLRNDQNKLFAAGVKKAAASRANGEGSAKGE